MRGKDERGIWEEGGLGRSGPRLSRDAPVLLVGGLAGRSARGRGLPSLFVESTGACIGIRGQKHVGTHIDIQIGTQAQTDLCISTKERHTEIHIQTHTCLGAHQVMQTNRHAA